MSERPTKVIVGKNTFISFGLMSSIIGATMFISGIKEQADTNAQKLSSHEARISTIRDKSEQRSIDLSSKLSKIEGKLDIIIQRVAK